MEINHVALARAALLALVRWLQETLLMHAAPVNKFILTKLQFATRAHQKEGVEARAHADLNNKSARKHRRAQAGPPLSARGIER
jgi:hypothetical protein